MYKTFYITKAIAVALVLSTLGGICSGHIQYWPENDQPDRSYLVWIEMGSDSQCVGTFIRDRYILTSGSCITTRTRDQATLTFQINGEYVKVENTTLDFYTNRDFDDNTLPIARLGIIRLSEEVEKTYGIPASRVRRLSTTDHDEKVFLNQEDTSCYLLGWKLSDTTDFETRKDSGVRVDIDPNSRCRFPLRRFMNREEICVNDWGTVKCNKRTSGHPLVCRLGTKQMAMLGVYERGDNTCSKRYQVLARVSSNRRWIRRVVNGAISPDNKIDGTTVSIPSTMSSPTSTSSTSSTTTPILSSCLPDTEFQCGDRTCISADKVCDGTSDCSEKEDEASCGCDLAGTEFVTGFLDNTGPDATILYISAAEMTTVTITIPFKNIVETHEIIGAKKLVYDDTLVVRDQVSNKGVHISSTKPIHVVSANSRESSYTTVDGTIVYPTNCLSTSYIVDSQHHKVLPGSQVLIIGVANITTTVNILFRLGASRTITLGYLDTYFMQTKDSRRMVVTSSDHNIVVMSGSKCGYMPYTSSASCDHMVNQMPPLESLGTIYLATHMKPRLGFSVRIIAPSGDSIANVRYANGTMLESVTLPVKSERVLGFYDGETISIEANNPILVSQYSHDASIDALGFGDPSMVTLPDVTQFGNDYSFVVPDHFLNVGVMVYISTAFNPNRLRLNGEHMAAEHELVTIPGYGSYYVLRISLQNDWEEVRYATLTHMNSDANFGAVLYGSRLEGAFAWRIGGKA